MSEPFIRMDAAMSRERFNQHVVAALRELVPQLLSVWQSSGTRTDFYKRVLLPRVAELVGCELRGEVYAAAQARVDFAFLRKSDSQPVAFIESENEAWRVFEAIHKLCQLQAELRAIMTVCPWDHEAVWGKTGSQRGILLPAWRAVTQEWLGGARYRTEELVVYVGEMHGKRFQLYEEILSGPAAPVEIGLELPLVSLHLP